VKFGAEGGCVTKRVRLALVGLGNVGLAFLDLLSEKAAILREHYGLEFTVTGAADSSGAMLDPTGLNVAALRQHKTPAQPGEPRPGIASFPGGIAGLPSPEMAERVEADLLLDASPVNLKTGQPGLDCVRTALRRGMPVVLANKGPLVLAFAELTAAADRAGVGLAYSATVCGALPVVNIGQRDLAACDIRSIAGVFNSTSNSILAAMGRRESYEAALRRAQIDGIAEADPSLDVEGWDTANKLVIIANSVLRMPATLADVRPVTGITGITAQQVADGLASGRVVKLVARAEQTGTTYRLSVQPEWLPATDFLATINGWEMGVVLDTDIMGLQQYKVDERGPVPTAAAMLRDAVRLSNE
jgi:homoserine dehydrogenase